MLTQTLKHEDINAETKVNIAHNKINYMVPSINT